MDCKKWTRKQLKLDMKYYPGILMEQVRKIKEIHDRQLLPQNTRVGAYGHWYVQ
jgi:hypothetical protein